MSKLMGNCKSLAFRNVSSVDIYYLIFFVKIARLGSQILDAFNIKSQTASKLFRRNWNIEVPIFVQKSASRIYSSCHI